MNEVSRWHDEKGGYIHNLEKNLTFLETTMEELRARRDDLSRRVTREEDRVENRCKVAFTTRSQDVCAHMGVEEPMEVQCLSDNDAFDLFQKKVGQVTLGSDPDLARTVARKCRGRLVRASLLMGDVTNKVCMHDIIREMALWIASDLGQGKEAFIVHAGTDIHHLPMGLLGLKNLIHLDLWDTEILRSHRLMSCTQHLEIVNITLEIVPLAIMDKLRSFCIKSWNISEIKMGNICSKRNIVSAQHSPSTSCFSSLSVVKIQDCNCLRELTLLMFASNLKELDVLGAKELKDIINKEKASRGEESGIAPFPKLIILRLSSLPELKNIHWKPLPLPCLKEICVMRCPNLKKLPLDSKSGRHGENGLFISYSRKEWIEDLIISKQRSSGLWLLRQHVPSG
ncbi:hypothetical protein Bca52824_059893 [Brassica carinata]|uniref:Disease resistance protein n=1 Tax=Brassica carinata TaxID=52824 RepID=A0A8X7R0E4_BRACI|nr:hypothetical protein Bca52824_059893 [Brassica carinata]